MFNERIKYLTDPKEMTPRIMPIFAWRIKYLREMKKTLCALICVSVDVELRNEDELDKELLWKLQLLSEVRGLY